MLKIAMLSFLLLMVFGVVSAMMNSIYQIIGPTITRKNVSVVEKKVNLNDPRRMHFNIEIELPGGEQKRFYTSDSVYHALVIGDQGDAVIKAGYIEEFHHHPRS